MNLIHRYLFRQISRPVMAACASLIGIALLSQSLDQLEIIVERGQSALTMLKLTILAVPQVLGVIIPIGVFVGALIALTRLQREQELVACLAGGASRWNLISPAMRIATFAALLCLAVTLFIQPAAQREARKTTFEIRTDLAALLVQEGQFVQTGEGLTVYAQQVDQGGLIRNLFIHQQQGDQVTTWDAETARFTRIQDRPVLAMQNGSIQRFSGRGVLNSLTFSTNVFDLSPFAQTDERVRFKEADLWMHELLFPGADLLERTGTRSQFIAEAHARLTSPLYALTAMALALAAILGGSFSRTGYSGRIAKVSAVFLVVRVMGFGVVAASAWSPWLAVLQYLFPIGVTALALWVVFRRPAARNKARKLKLAFGGAR